MGTLLRTVHVCGVSVLNFSELACQAVQIQSGGLALTGERSARWSTGTAGSCGENFFVALGRFEDIVDPDFERVRKTPDDGMPALGQPKLVSRYRLVVDPARQQAELFLRELGPFSMLSQGALFLLRHVTTEYHDERSL